LPINDICMDQSSLWRVCLREHTRFLDSLRQNIYRPYVDGFKVTGLSPDKVPTLPELNQSIASTGWELVFVPGFIPSRTFFEYQARKQLPLARNLRSLEDAAYSPQPDMFHDLLGHVPQVFCPIVSELCVAIGRSALEFPETRNEREQYAAELELSTLLAHGCTDQFKLQRAEQRVDECKRRTAAAPDPFDLLIRFYLWTIEFGVVRASDGPQVVGAGLLSSRDECIRVISGGTPLRRFDESAFQHAINFSGYQDQLFVLDELGQAFELLQRLLDSTATRRSSNLIAA